ncbi:formate/nitrite transporter family protein [Paenibacillus sp.]|uniref:formate/nitrite transporter family protein n=1 Tax=Paenibacillus sp. TaxID=58172 RepID=UPI0028175106|nr:formate/nitrite transporter family protein [Paenibacillus sp.]MDR0268237.1 formate/nitrite transporter family protein [Paenibacillus sp.]
MSSFSTPQQIKDIAIEVGEKKAKTSLPAVLVLGFLAGAFIALGFLLDIRVIGTAPKEWGSVVNLLGGAVFPVGLILTVLAGGELLTGNMMALPMAWFARKIGFGSVLKNLALVTIANFVGSVFVAYFFGHVVGLTEGAFLAKTTAIATAKINDSFLQAFVSGIGCNWLVCLAVWLAFGAKDFSGKIIGMWFPVMAFVAIGFQHVVANMFVIPAAIFSGQMTWGQYFPNFGAVFLGNLIGGMIFVAGAYFVAYRQPAGAPALSKQGSQKSA